MYINLRKLAIYNVEVLNKNILKFGDFTKTKKGGVQDVHTPRFYRILIA